MAETAPAESWAECQQDLLRLSRLQLFFVGGAPRSGTTWLQQILDSHPEVSCRGEGLFAQHFATPLERVAADRRKVLEEKNAKLFRHTGGYPLPHEQDTEIMLGTAILLGFRQQVAGKPCRAVGEKTPENVFVFPRLKRLFPAAKFIGIARDPRDVLTSAWHFFHEGKAGADEAGAKLAFVRSALPSLGEGARRMLALDNEFPHDTVTVTYEALLHAPAQVAAQLFRFLDVSDRPEVVAACLERTDFTRQTGGRPKGVANNGAFHRRGVAGDWKTTITPELNALILQELGWMFPQFGWQP